MEEKKGKNNQFIQFVKDSKYAIMIMTIFVLFAFGERLISNSYSIDTEHYIYNIGNSVNWDWWISLNRWGLVFLNKITQLGAFPIFASNFLTVIIMLSYSITFNYLFYTNIKQKYQKTFIKYQFIFPILFLTSPIFAEQYNFVHQNVGVALAILMIPISLLCIQQAMKSEEKVKKIGFYGIAIAMSIVGFGVYQSIILLYIVTVVSCYLLKVIKEEDNQWKYLGKQIGIFAISCIGYMIVSKIVAGEQSSYLQIGWLSSGIIQCIKNVVYCVLEVLRCNTIFYNIGYILAACVGLAAIVYVASKKKLKIGMIIGMIGLLAAPFYIMMITGVDQLKRTQFNYSYIIGFTLMMVVIFFANKPKIRIVKIGMLVAVLVIAYIQAYTSSNLFHSVDVVYQNDVLFANQLVNKIENQSWYDSQKEYTLIFVGKHEQNLKNVYQKGEVIGQSFFEFDYENIWGVNQRANVFLNILGYQFKNPTAEEFEIAKQYVQQKEIKPWNSQEAIALMNENKIIVRLSQEM